MASIYGLIYTAIEADKTLYFYLIQKFNLYFLHLKKFVFSNKSRQKKLFFGIYLKMYLYGCIKHFLMYMSGKFEVCSFYPFFSKTFY